MYEKICTNAIKKYLYANLKGAYAIIYMNFVCEKRTDLLII